MDCQAIKRVELLPLKQGYTKEQQRMDAIVVVDGTMDGNPGVNEETRVENGKDFSRWIEEWRHSRKLDFSLESKHFFLEGSDLDDFTKQMIRMAEETILAANPYIESCYLTDYLINSAKNQTEITIVTRQPEAEKKDFAKKVECHSKLRQKGIALHYDNQIHSKIIAVDNKVAIASSMNFYSGSSGGASKEAGIVSIDQRVVESATNYIRKLLDES